MRSLILTTLVAFVLGIVAAFNVVRASAEEPASADVAKVEAKPVEVAKADVAKEFKPPPGFLKKRRGDVVVYCEKRANVGTRFKTEQCYDEQQLRAFLLQREQQNRELEQRRGVCVNASVCSPP